MSSTAASQKRAHALREALDEMEASARAGGTMTYTELSNLLTTTYAPNGRPFSTLLCDVSRKTYAKQKVLLSAVVVHDGDGLPGNGFFSLAEELGLDVEDRQDFWNRAIAKVHDAYASGGNRADRT
jgi:methyl coenzyme M reductase subunit C